MAKVAEIIAVLPHELMDATTAREFAHDLGHSLAEIDDEGLLAVRNALVNVYAGTETTKETVAILVEIVDGFRLGRKRHDVIVVRKGLSRDVLACLERGVSTTGELAAYLECDDSQVSRVLDRLRAVDLVEPPQREPIDRRRATHQLTLRAKEMLRRLDRAERTSDVWRLSAAPARVELVVDENPTGKRRDEHEVVVAKQPARARAVADHGAEPEPSVLKGSPRGHKAARATNQKPTTE
jgi:DNA-binding MarR family transcriptional regulator